MREEEDEEPGLFLWVLKRKYIYIYIEQKKWSLKVK